MIKQCKICGKDFEPMNLGWTRRYCYECSPHEDEDCNHADAVTVKRRAIKRMLVNYKGGKCAKCGYDKCLRALQFHHLDLDKKDFGVSAILTRNISSLKEEVDKCILLCSNCHAEEHERLYEEGYTQFNLDI